MVDGGSGRVRDPRRREERRKAPRGTTRRSSLSAAPLASWAFERAWRGRDASFPPPGSLPRRKGSHPSGRPVFLHVTFRGMKLDWEPPRLPAWPNDGIPGGFRGEGDGRIASSPSPLPFESIQRSNAEKSDAWKWWSSLGSPRYWMAPMVDQSELAFRLLCKRHGTEGAYTPMIHARMFLSDPIYAKETLTSSVPIQLSNEGQGTEPSASDRPLIAQFCANDASLWLKAAEMVAPHVDAVDLNLGCPQRIAKRGQYGAFLMDKLEDVKDMVTHVVERLSVPVTAKIRIFDDTEATVSYAKMLQDAGCFMIAVHGRTREMKKSSEFPPDWRAIQAVRAALTIPVLANGGVRSLREAHALMSFTGAHGVLSAEPLLEDPALFKLRTWQAPTDGEDDEQIAKERTIEKACLLREYVALACAHKTPLRMVKAHIHRMVGNWLAEFVDLREALNSRASPPSLDMLAAISESIACRMLSVVESGRWRPIPVLSGRILARMERESAQRIAIDQQNKEDENAKMWASLKSIPPSSVTAK